MFHRIGLRVGSLIAEREFERALIFCGTGMGIHIAASKCPHVHAGVVESVPAALRAITGNGVNVLAMGAFYVAPQMGCDIADAYLNAELGTGYEWWHNFYEFHKLAIDELEAFDYEEYKKNGFKVKHLGRLPAVPGEQGRRALPAARRRVGAALAAGGGPVRGAACFCMQKEGERDAEHGWRQLH